jgi:hypothetical protein
MLEFLILIDGVWATVLWTAVDREDRRGGSAGRGLTGPVPRVISGTVTTASRAAGKAL